MQVEILCVAGTTFEDRAIAAVESAQLLPAVPLPLCTHVALIFVDDAGETSGVEAVPSAVHVFSPAVYIGVQTRRYPLRCTPAQARIIEATATMAVGRPYGWMDLLAAATYVLEGHPEQWLADPHARLDCSALVATCLAASGLEVQPGVPPDAVTPAAVESFALQQHPLA